MLSVRIENSDVAAGDYLYIHYSGFDEEHNIREASFNFINEDNTQFRVYDNDGDGVASYRLSNNQALGEYFLAEMQIRDTAYNYNQLKYESNGSTYYYYQPVGETLMENIVSTFPIFVNVTEAIPAQDPQTDFDPPVLNDLELFTRENVIEIIEQIAVDLTMRIPQIHRLSLSLRWKMNLPYQLVTIFISITMPRI